MWIGVRQLLSAAKSVGQRKRAESVAGRGAKLEMRMKILVFRV